MIRARKQAVVILAVFVALAAAAAEAPDRYKLTTGLDLSIIDSSGYPAWTEGGAGKLRYGGNNEGLIISRAFADYELQITDTLKAHAAVEAYDDDIGSTVDFTEAYAEWRPVPRSPNRYRLKLGAFYPRVSLENVSAGWSSPYTISPAAINTWIAEEVRAVGAELSLSRRPEMFGGSHTIGLQAAIFFDNDPTGSLLAWKGWSIHDRQSRFGDELPLAPLPQIQPGMMFEAQDPYVAPFREIDDRAGYYLNGEWRMGQQLLLRAMHYDNRANPTALEGGQYAWATRFQHIGAQVLLPANWQILYQWMNGSTAMGPVINDAHVVDADFYSEFVLLTKSFSRHRISARYDRFAVSDNDQVPLDDNAEYGHAWTFAYQFEATDHVALAAEAMNIFSYREAWEYYGLDEEQTERQLQLSLRLRFGN
jgi:hypothetical protein